MNVSAWSIRNPVPAAMLFVMLSLLGLLSFRIMKIQNFPDMDLPLVSVVATLPGASPGQLENEVARKLENSLVNIQGIKHLHTTLVDGTAAIMAEFELEKPLQEAVDDIRVAVDRTRTDLPLDLQGPIINKFDVSRIPSLVFAIHSDKLAPEALSWFIDDIVTRRLLTVSGVGAINRIGGVSREVKVELDPFRLQALGLTAADVSRKLRAQQQDSTSGRADFGGSEYSLRTLASIETATEIGALEINLPGRSPVRIDQIATISDGISEVRSSAQLNGEEVIAFDVSRSRGASEINVARGVEQVIANLQQEYPDLHFTRAVDFATIGLDEYHASMQVLYEGALLAVLVVWFFLRNARATIVSAVALPLSVIPAFAGMYLMGFTINAITLLALSLVIGILVDDAIVEVENIVRHQRNGKSPYQAAMEAADEIGLAVIATTFSLIAVFVPTAFLSGIAGRFFKQFGWTAAAAVFSSLLVARMLTPMMAAYIFKPVTSTYREPRWLNLYMHLSEWCLRHRLVTLLSALVFFVVSLGLTALLPTSFIPPDDNEHTQIELELPPGSRLSDTLVAAEQARQIALKNGHVEHVFTAIGSGSSAGSDMFAQGSTSGDPRRATLTLRLSPRSERPQKQEIDSWLQQSLQELGGMRVKVGLGASHNKYNIMLSSNESQMLTLTARALEKDLRTIPGVGSVTSNAGLSQPEIVIRPDYARMADLGVSTIAIADTLRIATQGDFEHYLSKLNLPQRQIPVVVRLNDRARDDLTILRNLQVPGTHGPVRLNEVAELEIANRPALISRYDRQRSIQFDIGLGQLDMGEIDAAIVQLPTMQNLPSNVHWNKVGNAEEMVEMFMSFGLAMLMGVLSIYIVLVLLFKDFLHPFTILTALPLSLGGAFVGLLITGKSFSLPSLIGLIMLMGIATKNSILMVEYAIVARRERGLSRTEALLDACHKRARPIIMTSMAMGAGMLPVALSLGSSDMSFRSPMAIAVIGGLVTSTLLSLLVIPTVFTYVDDFEVWLRRLFRLASPPQAKDTATESTNQHEAP